jgi:hypothetical protein
LFEDLGGARGVRGKTAHEPLRAGSERHCGRRYQKHWRQYERNFELIDQFVCVQKGLQR